MTQKKDVYMKTHTVLTPANIEIEYRLAGAGSRLAAFVVDFALQVIFCLILAVVILFGIYDYRFATLVNVQGFALGFLIISCFTIYFCYFIVCEMTMNGQSVGKKIFALRVIRDNGQAVGLQQSLVRNLFKAVLDIIYVGLFFILFSPQHKRIGDIVAGTVVVAEYYDSAATPLRSANMPDPKRAGMEQLKHLILNEKERDLLNMYMARKMYLPEAAKLSLLRQWSEYLAGKWQIEPSQINDDILAALLQLNESEY